MIGREGEGEKSHIWDWGSKYVKGRKTLGRAPPLDSPRRYVNSEKRLSEGDGIHFSLGHSKRKKR